ncbi:MAG: radical SAM family heme chaperone HemW [Rubricella sp.]
MSGEPERFGVYVHWPFCQAKCPYCDFNSHVSSRVDHARWRAAFSRDIAKTAASIGPRRTATVFFGGGTPSLMEPETVAHVLREIDRHWPLKPTAEVTLEANPTSVEAGRFSAFREAGINRVSMGVQSLRDPDLRRLGRMHSAADARAAFDIARREFDRVSFDLIYARQDQTVEDWRAELEEATAMAVDHLSLYQLTIEAGTRFGEMYDRGMLKGLPDGDTSSQLYEITNEFLGARGMPAYEISNHARPGAESRHNLVYWRYEEYAGIGPGAHGRIMVDGQRHATETALHPEAWLARVEQTGSGETLRVPLDAADQGIEYLLMSLRLAEGSDPARYERLSGTRLDPSRMQPLLDDGFLVLEQGRLRATEKGRPVLNRVLAELIG